MLYSRRTMLFTAALAASVQFAGLGFAYTQELTNVSYDPTRELYRQYNDLFVKHWKEKTGETAKVTATHGGSGSQARTVVDGLPADVVSLALASDILPLEAAGLIEAGWQQEFPDNSTPYVSTIVFLVRSGNPKGIKDWDDLIRDDIQVITPNPKTSGGARWNYLAAWAYELDRTGGDEEAAKEFLTKLYQNVPVLDSGARGSTNTFVQRGLGDVLLAWENEAFLALNELGKDKFDIVVPSLSILAEPPVSVVDGNVDAKGTRKVAEAYLAFLYTPAAQAVIARHYYRPVKPEAAAADDMARFPKVKLITIDEAFGGWDKAQKLHFANGGIFDAMLQANR